jgi:predicted nucleic acid-binding Zn ribbon protein
MQGGRCSGRCVELRKKEKKKGKRTICVISGNKLFLALSGFFISLLPPIKISLF